MDKTSIGDRIKKNYEDRYRYFLPRKNYTIIRIDGKAFHSYVKGDTVSDALEKPFDDGFMEDLNYTAIELCKQLMGVKLAFVQSDEISLLLTDWDQVMTQAWFDYNLQKMTSVSSSIATSEFNRLRYVRHITSLDNMFEAKSLHPLKDANFDSRVFQIPKKDEVMNYFIWRQQDATRNSIQSVGQYYFSHKQLHKKNVNDIQNMLLTEKDVNWNDYDPKYKRGRTIIKKYYGKSGATRSKWVVDEAPIFTQDKEYLDYFIPDNF